MNKPLVSILTPSYNQGRWLGDNLKSVAGQTYPNIEHLVMDGGSVDESLEVLMGAASPNLVWETRPDEGQSDAINKAFERSSGEIIGWLNSDDAYFSRDAVASAVRIFNRCPEVGVVYGHAALVNASGALLHVLWAPRFSGALLRAHNFVCQPTIFVRRAAVGRPSFVDPSFDYMMDFELLLHLSQRTRFRRLDRIIAIDRHHMKRKSYTRLDIAAHDYALIQRRYAIPRVASSRLVRKTLKFAIRLAGLAKLVEARRGSDVVALQRASIPSMAFRQVAQPRRGMRSEGN